MNQQSKFYEDQFQKALPEMIRQTLEAHNIYPTDYLEVTLTDNQMDF